MITYGKSEYVEELKLLWQDTFGDSRRFINSFFANVYNEENTLVAVEDGHAVASLYMIPYKMLIGDNAENIVYLYALATDPSYRARGIMSSLIQKSFDISSERNYSLSVLIPARESLVEFYRKFGYEYCFNKVMITKSFAYIKKQSTNHKPIKLTKANAKQIWNIYKNSIFTSEGSIILSEAQNTFYIEEFEKEGGEAVVFCDGEKDYYALLMQAGNEIIIYESNIDASVINQFYATLIEKYHFQSVSFYQPICFPDEETKNNRQSFAMAKSFTEVSLKDTFINRVLT